MATIILIDYQNIRINNKRLFDTHTQVLRNANDEKVENPLEKIR